MSGCDYTTDLGIGKYIVYGPTGKRCREAILLEAWRQDAPQFAGLGIVAKPGVPHARVFAMEAIHQYPSPRRWMGEQALGSRYLLPGLVFFQRPAVPPQSGRYRIAEQAM